MQDLERLLAQGRRAEAIALLEGAVARAPAAVLPRYQLAVLLLESGALDKGQAQIDRVLKRDPDFAPALFTKARLLETQGRCELAERCYRRTASLPEFAADSFLGLGNVLRRLNRIEEAAAAYRRRIELAPRHPAGYGNLAQMLLPIRPADALAALDDGLRQLPDAALLHALRGQSLLRLGRPSEAVEALRRALELAPSLAAARGHLLRAYREAARWDDEEAAFAALRVSLAASPAPQGLAIPIQSALNFPFSPAELKAIAASEARWRTAALPREAPPKRRPPAPPPLVVGYLSPDYRDHPIAHLVAELLAAHDRARVRVVALSEGPSDGSPVERRIRDGVDRFVDLQGGDDRAAAARIAGEGVHILVDLSLFTRYHRPGIPFLRPAPVQAAWLGLPTTTGAGWFDYLLVDDVVAPAAHADRFTERLVWLPYGYQPNPAPVQAAPPPRAEAGLPDGAFVFACFNSHLKIDRGSFRAWMAILAAAPGSVLWLLAPPAEVEGVYRAEAARQGVAAERLIFAPKLPHDEHLARLPLADLVLDTLIYGAHTTCSDALRSGVPVLTVLGEQFAARVGASLLTRLDLPELICSDVAEFRALAATLAGSPARLAALRAKLAARLPTAALFDPALQARALEAAYERMWRLHLDGAPPQSFSVPPAPDAGSREAI